MRDTLLFVAVVTVVYILARSDAYDDGFLAGMKLMADGIRAATECAHDPRNASLCAALQEVPAALEKIDG